MAQPDLLHALYAQLAEPFTADVVFDCLPNVVYFLKNVRAEYVVVNRTLAERCGTPDKRTLIGKTAAQAFPPPLGRSFWEQDLQVIASGEPVRNQLELHLYPTGQTGWCLTDKFPLRDIHSTVVGLVGVSHDLQPPDRSDEDYSTVANAVHYAQTHLDQRLVIDDLAEFTGLSAYQFDQRIRRLFALSTGQLLLKLRMDYAAKELRESERPVVAIGLSCGYCDQSAFARQFRRTTGLTPIEYRRTCRGATDLRG